MKYTYTILLTCLSYSGLFAQFSTIGAPMSVNAPNASFPEAVMVEGGSVLVKNEGLWNMNGNIISAEKDLTPSVIARAESIKFQDNGAYDNANLNVGTASSSSNGWVINGYGAVENKNSSFILPLGVDDVAFPITVPENSNLNVGYYLGNGNSINIEIENIHMEVFSPYYDVQNSSSIQGDFVFSYPGFVSSEYDYLLAFDESTSSYFILKELGENQYNNTYSNIAISDINLPSGTFQIYFGTSSTPLPIKLIMFEAKKVNSTSVLEWNTLLEENNKGFEIQRSLDGKNWEEIGYSNSKSENGYSKVKLIYNFIDNNPEAGTNYYRLKQVDYNGNFAYSQVRQVLFTDQLPSVTIYPNPARDYIIIDGLSHSSNIYIINTNSQIVYTQEINNENNKIDLNQFATGLYTIIVVRENGEKQYEKLLISH